MIYKLIKEGGYSEWLDIAQWVQDEMWESGMENSILNMIILV